MLHETIELSGLSKHQNSKTPMAINSPAPSRKRILAVFQEPGRPFDDSSITANSIGPPWGLP